jgi:hypothetical protein
VEFFIDRNLGTRIFPEILREAGLVIHLHQDYFPQQEKDRVWIARPALEDGRSSVRTRGSHVTSSRSMR